MRSDFFPHVTHIRFLFCFNDHLNSTNPIHNCYDVDLDDVFENDLSLNRHVALKPSFKSDTDKCQ